MSGSCFRPALFVLLLVGATRVASPAGDPAAEAVRGLIEVEQTMLGEELERHEVARTRRVAVMSRLDRLYRTLDAARTAHAPDQGRTADEHPGPDLDLLLAELDLAESERSAAFAVERAILAAVQDRSRRIALLEEQHGELEGRAPKQPSGTLSGTWSLVMMPIEQRGVWSLSQSGAVVSGTYELGGGWSGSLQGTLVDRKLFLIRIDSKKGKVMEYEGFLSADKQTLRGTWLNYELVGTEGSSGQWSAQRRADDH